MLGCSPQLWVKYGQTQPLGSITFLTQRLGLSIFYPKLGTFLSAETYEIYFIQVHIHIHMSFLFHCRRNSRNKNFKYEIQVQMKDTYAISPPKNT